MSAPVDSPIGRDPGSPAGRAALAALIRPGWAEMAVVLAALLIALVGVAQGVGAERWINQAAPVVLTIGLSIGVVRMFRISSLGIWAPLMWLRIVMIAYSGIGSIVPFFANTITLDQMDRFFTLYPGDMAKYNAVAAAYSLCVLIAARIVAAYHEMARSITPARHKAPESAFDALQFGLIAFFVGLPLKLLLEWLPFIGFDAIALPASVSVLVLLVYLSYPLLILGLLERGSRLVWLVAIPIAIDSLYGLLTFNKSYTLFPLIFATLGFFIHRARLGRAIVAGVALFAIYLAITPVTNYGRGVSYGQTPRLDTNLAITLSYRPGYETRLDTEEYQAAWARLTYITGGSYAISQYDRGLPGESLSLIVPVLVPRVLYPDKPEVTRIFAEFNRELTGSDTSQSSPGIPAEGYWNYGWPGVIVVGLIMGGVFAFWSLYSAAVVASQSWHLMFVVFMGIRTAARVDGLFATDFVPLIVLGVVAHVALTFLNSLVLRNRMAGGRITIRQRADDARIA